MINHYEIKEFRDLAKEEAMDKQNYEQYMAQKTGGFHLNDLVTHPHMTQILQQLLEIMQNSDQMHHPNQMQNFRGGHRGGMNQRGGHFQQRGGHGQGHFNQRGGGQQHHMQGGMPQPGGQGMPQPGGMPAPGGMGQGMGQPMPGRPGPPGGMQQMPGAPQQQPMQGQVPVHVRYNAACQKILPSCSERNQNLKEQVGQIIYEFVSLMVPHERAPKVTGMLIEIPVDQIKAYMQDFQVFTARVKEANQLIDNAEKAAMQQQQ